MFIKKLIIVCISFLFVSYLSSCKQGIQGGKVDNSFQGVADIQVLSPTSIKLTWIKDSKYLNYKIYQKGQSVALGTSSFSEYILSGLLPDSEYEFSVSGIASDDTGEEDFQQKFLKIKTFPRFSGLQATGVSVISSNRVNISWPVNGYGITYKVQYKRPFESVWVDAKIVTSQTDTVEFEEAVTSLMGGTNYCFQLVALYADETFEPTESNQPSHCVTTNTDLTNLPAVHVGSSTPGIYPWFNAIGGNPTYIIDVFNEASPAVPIATLNNGTGVFRSSFPFDPGDSDLYAIVRDTSNGVQARVDINYFAGTQLKTRAFVESGEKGPVHPPLVNGGQGLQNLGSKMVSGDFNCDGLTDVAVGAPKASPVATPSLVYATGAVIIYYGYDPPFDNTTATDPDPYLNTTGVPAVDSVFPSPHLIHYPLGTNDNLGANLSVGNFNGDCFYRDGTAPVSGLCAPLYETHKNNEAELAKIKTCDDLAITGRITSSVLFAVFGDPLQGLVSGSGGSNFGLDEYTCDSGSSSCRSVRLTANSDNGVGSFGKAIATGDFNNDGFDDLAVTSNYSDGGVDKNRVYILRGTDQGLTPVNGSSSFAPVDTNVGSVFSDSQQSDNFGFSVSAAYNSRLCQAGTGFEYRRLGPTPNTGYDFTKCDDLVIGAPSRANGRGSIYTCKGNLPTKDSVSDDEKITSWTCLEHFPADIDNEGDNAGYGSSLLSVRNQNGYPVSVNNIYPAASGILPNVAGALFVGAPRRQVSGQDDAGSVYGYYIVPGNVSHASGGIQGVFANSSGQHTTAAPNSVACDAKNLVCNHQQLTNSPAQADALFGTTLSYIEDIDGNRGLPYVAIAAPNRNVANSAGTANIANSGVVYLYNPDISTLGTENGVQITSTQVGSNLPGCDNECTWLSGGLSPFGPVVIYPQDLTNSSFFGIGGSVGGDFNSDGFGDLLSSAPFLSSPIQDSGGLFGFHSNDGSFSPVENQVDFSVNLNISNELNYRFENAKIVGDINQDGYDDVVSKIEIGSKVSSIVYYGSANGLITGVAPSYTAVGLNPKILLNSVDNTMGKRFYRIGSVNCDSFDDILLVGSKGSYIYYGASTGLISGTEPNPSPVGKNPLAFGRIGTDIDSLPLSNNNFVLSGFESVYDTSNQGVGFGDFNGDQCNDIAIGVDSSTDFSGVSNLEKPLLNFGSEEPNYSATNRGRVVVLYGGPSGLQVNDPEGILRLSRPGGLVGNVVAGEPCDSSGVCQVQLLASPGLSIGGYAQPSRNFGADVIGIESFGETNGEIFDEIAVSSPEENNDNGAVYIFQGSTNGVNISYHQRLMPDLDSGSGDTTNFSQERFGQYMAFIGDANGDNFSDIAISSPGTNNITKGHVYIFYGGTVGADFGFVGESSLKQADHWDLAQNPLGPNEIFVSANDIRPQVLSPINVANDDLFGRGLSSAGDFNRDGFSDFLANVAVGDYLQEVSLPDSGFSIMYFGSDLGLQINIEESISPKCVYAGQPVECAPYQVYLPDRLSQERTYISNTAFGDVDGDNNVDIIMGARGRNHPSGQATATGVFYIMY